jgi:hypothetical protein
MAHWFSAREQEVDKRWIQARSQYQNTEFEVSRETEPRILRQARPIDFGDDAFNVVVARDFAWFTIAAVNACLLLLFSKVSQTTTPLDSQRNEL